MAKSYFEPIDPKADFPKMEDELISSWKKNKIFEKTISERPVDKTWTFLDGPPFITGLPHYGTLLSSIPKDLFPRYWTMKGYRVRRVWGWDCHGLPAENKVENKLGLKRKRDIEDVVGVGKFIQECKNYVKDVSSEWDWYIDHIGRWVDFKNAYRTMDTNYMESVMWVFKQMYEKKFIYKGLRISLYCPHCATPISNFEVAMDNSYKEVTEVSNTYKYELVGSKDKKTYILAWSTTPWTKITTTALAINPKFTYVKVEHDGEYYILAKTTLEKVFAEKEYKVVEEIKGSDLVGLSYLPHYDFFEKEKGKKVFEVVGGDFVTADEGTGVVTIAPYGEEDMRIMEKENIQIVMHVDDEGKFTPNVPNWGGVFYSKTNPLINEDLKNRGLLFDEQPIVHSVATCWRCSERLIYSPQNAWYVDVQKLKPDLIKNNENVNWFPSHFKHGRFLKSMESAPDWCISRSRYWGSPVPVWECKCGERFVPGSIAELEEASGEKINDLHKPEIDEIEVKCKVCGEKTKRVPEVLDSWIEAGSAAFAERHYPFDKEYKLEDFFPPDFIVEYTGQIRAWFYVLHVISTALLETNAYKNVLVTGVILGTDGRKMSKNFGNYPDPKEMIQKYGGDALRLYLMNTPVMKSEDTIISEEQYRNEVRNYLLTLWNVYNFFVTYSNMDGWKPSEKDTTSENVLDTWIKLRLNQVTIKSAESMEKYDTITYAETLKEFLSDLSTWYLRRSRDRRDSEFYSTMFDVLVTFSKVSAPMTPFISELIYTNLTKEESVHLAMWPEVSKLSKENIIMLDKMKLVRQIVEHWHSVRKERNIPLRQPLSQLQLMDTGLEIFEELLKDELNVKKIIFGSLENHLNDEITPELKEEADTRDLVRKIQAARKELGVQINDKVNLSTPWMPETQSLKEWLFKKTLVDKVTTGEFGVSLVNEN